MGSIPRLRRSPGRGYSNSLQFSCLENPMDRGAWQTTVYRVAKSYVRLKRISMQHAQYTFPILHNKVSELVPFSSVQFSSVQSLSCVRLFVTPWIAARQASLSITSSQSLLKLMSIESVMPSSHLILCCPLLLLPPIPPSMRIFSNKSLHEVAKVLEFQLQHQSFQWTPRTDLL